MATELVSELLERLQLAQRENNVLCDERAQLKRELEAARAELAEALQREQYYAKHVLFLQDHLQLQDRVLGAVGSRLKKLGNLPRDIEVLLGPTTPAADLQIVATIHELAKEHPAIQEYLDRITEVAGPTSVQAGNGHSMVAYTPPST